MMANGNSSKEFRLPENVIPVHYDLDIITYLGSPEGKGFYFEGNALIKIKCLQPTKTVKLHSRDLKLKSDLVTVSLAAEANSKRLNVAATLLDSENDFFIITLSNNLEKETEYLINLAFEAPLRDDLVGFYRSSYNENNTIKYLATTHFEPSDARLAFPCFDEPAMKATFHVRLGHDQSLKAVSNMPLRSTSPLAGVPNFVWSEFETTVRMSTYLIAYMISEFESVESEHQTNNVTFRVWARKDAIGQTAFPATVGPKFLSFYEDFFGVKYPLPKQDLLAIPDFKIGAMENWGLITFRESSLLLDESTTSSTTRLHIASIIAHELAHMWFGNLVTMHWWTDLWLKEGFATYMATLAVHHVFPEWNSLDALDVILTVFHLDSLKSSHPVSVPIKHPREISQIFDAISYEKGSFLLRMMSLFLGEEVFRHGINGYLSKHQFLNAEQDDLWESLTEQAHRYSVLSANLTVKEIMDCWTLQTGFPLITVQRNLELHDVTITQKRYLAIESGNEADYVGSWWIPLSYSTEKEPRFNETQPQKWMPKSEKSIGLHINASENEWIIFNNRVAGLYKVNYDNHNWQLLSNTLNSQKFENIEALNRALLIIDAMDFANCGILDYKIALNLITYVQRETSFVPLQAALSKLDVLKKKLCRTPIYGDFKNLVRPLFKSVISRLGSIDKIPDSFEEGRLISLISAWACPLSIGKFDEQAMTLFHKWYTSDDPDAHNPIPKDVRPAVYGHAVEVGGEKYWNFLWDRIKHTNVVAEKNTILMALTNCKEIWILDRYLEWTLTDEKGIRKQDAFLIFGKTATRELGFLVAQKFFYRNIERISKYFGANSNLIGRYVSAIADQMVHPVEYSELKAFSEKYHTLLAPASLTVEQALETVQLNIRWMEKHFNYLSTIMKTDKILV